MIGVLTFIGARLIASNKCFELIESGAPISPEKRAAGRVATGSCVNVTPHLGGNPSRNLEHPKCCNQPKRSDDRRHCRVAHSSC